MPRSIASVIKEAKEEGSFEKPQWHHLILREGFRRRAEASEEGRS